MLMVEELPGLTSDLLVGSVLVAVIIGLYQTQHL